MSRIPKQKDHWGKFSDPEQDPRNRQEIERFVDEAHSLGALDDPNIANLLRGLRARPRDAEIKRSLAEALEPYRVRNIVDPDPLRPYPDFSSGLSVGELEVGNVHETGVPWRIPVARLPHFLIAGMTESGKTSLILGLLDQITLPFLLITLKSDIAHLLFDPHVVRQAFMFSEMRLSLFAPPPGLTAECWSRYVIDFLVRDLGLQYGRVLLDECMNDLLGLFGGYSRIQGAPFHPSLRNVLDMVKRRRRSKYCESTTAALTMACNALGNTVEYSQGWDPATLFLKSASALAIDSVPHANAARFYVDVLMEYLHASLRAFGPNDGTPQCVTVLDDGHRYMAKANERDAMTPLSERLLIVRQAGLRYVLISQSPSDVARAVLSQSGIIIQVGPMTATDDVRAIAGALGLSPSAIERLQQTNQREFVSRENLGRWKQAFGGKVRELVRAGTSITDAQRLACMQPLYDALPSHPSIPLQQVEKALGIDVKGAVPAVKVSPRQTDAKKLAEDILVHPWDFVTARYTRLNLSAGKGNAAKKELLGRGWVRERPVPTGPGSPSILLEPLPALAKALKTRLPSCGKGGFLHAFVQQAVVKKLKATGHTQVGTETAFGSKLVDVTSMDPSGQLVGIEVSIHLTNLVDNLAKDFKCRPQFGCLVVICIDSCKARSAKRLIKASVELQPYQSKVVVETVAKWL